MIKGNSPLYLRIEQAKEKAVRSGKHVLVSHVEKMKETCLTDVFALRRFAGNRFFWSDPGRRLSYVGLGSVLSIESDRAEQRFAKVEKEWKGILDNGLADEGIPEHTGPLLFGGFSFDPGKRQSPLWQDFSPVRFVVPQFMVTKEQGEAWLTTNVYVSPESPLNGDEEIWRYEHLLEQVQAETFSPQGPRTMAKEELSASEWMDSVREATASIRDGRMDKVVLARQLRLKAEHAFSIREILDGLLKEQMNTYVFAIDHKESCFVGATPERLVKRTGKELLTLSLAGSVARGEHAEEDDRLGEFLLKDDKNLHEHALAVQMIKGAMLEICDSVDAPETPLLYKFKDIQHLATPIAGHARGEISLLHAVEMLHPTPALGGMPREAAVAAIRELEQMDRGWYAAPIGWLDRHMDGEFVAGIRSALVQGDEAVLFAGCGIVGDSDPVSEFNETSIKFRPMLKALRAIGTDA